MVAGLFPATAAPHQAPRRPPEPFSVFVHSAETADAELNEAISEAVQEVRNRVRSRDDWFRLAEARDDAALTLRITNYRRVQRMIPRLEQLVLNGRVELVERSEIIEVHYVDALAAAPAVAGLQAAMTGLDERDRGPSLRNAANHLAEQLEEFVKEHYQAVTASEPPGFPGVSGAGPE